MVLWSSFMREDLLPSSSLYNGDNIEDNKHLLLKHILECDFKLSIHQLERTFSIILLITSFWNCVIFSITETPKHYSYGWINKAKSNGQYLWKNRINGLAKTQKIFTQIRYDLHIVVWLILLLNLFVKFRLWPKS